MSEKNTPAFWVGVGALWAIACVLRLVQSDGQGLAWIPAVLGAVLCWANAVRLWRRGKRGR